MANRRSYGKYILYDLLAVASRTPLDHCRILLQPIPSLSPSPRRSLSGRSSTVCYCFVLHLILLLFMPNEPLPWYCPFWQKYIASPLTQPAAPPCLLFLPPIAVGSRIKYLVDTPEEIWGCLDTMEYLQVLSFPLLFWGV